MSPLVFVSVDYLIFSSFMSYNDENQLNFHEFVFVERMIHHVDPWVVPELVTQSSQAAVVVLSSRFHWSFLPSEGLNSGSRVGGVQFQQFEVKLALSNFLIRL